MWSRRGLGGDESPRRIEERGGSLRVRDARVHGSLADVLGERAVGVRRAWTACRERFGPPRGAAVLVAEVEGPGPGTAGVPPAGGVHVRREAA